MNLNTPIGPRSIPASVQPLDGTAGLDWFLESLKPASADESGGFPLSRVMPHGFQSYARIFHPAYVGSSRSSMSWGEVARRLGTTTHPLVQFWEICGFTRPDQAHPEFQAPPIGRAPEETLYALLSLLEGYTGDQERVIYCVWEGYSDLHTGYQDVPMVAVGYLNYLVLAGPLLAMAEFADENRPMTVPSIWWPASREWCVFTDVDSDSTYVGGSADLVNALVNSDALEAFVVALDARIV